ncbi:luciferase family protein [Streptomyces sp. NPDC018059]|uniref:luciferase domain-containing protein n=1 Tax=Streptomyces sp. NPDC018059 TaxID=3365041 RepID=UPI0037B76D6D
MLPPPRLNAEFAHVHTDGSLHLALSSEDRREVIARAGASAIPSTRPASMW